MSKTTEVITPFDERVIPCYARRPIVFVKGKGAKLWDINGKVYLDFLAGIAVLNVGHSHPTVVAAIQQQAAELMHVSNLYYTPSQGLLAEKLAGLALGGKCFFCNSGAEANEALIKLARLWGHENNRFEIITMKNSFHGRTLATLTATGQEKVQKGFEPLPSGFRHARLNDLGSVKEVLTPRTAAILVEAVQGEGGVIPATQEFMQGLRALCNEKGYLLLCDEVQCGLGRTGKWFAFQHFDVEPDAFSLAKALGSGFPIGAIVTNPKLANVLKSGKHASTFGGNPLACAAAMATLQVIEQEGLLPHAWAMGEKLKQGLQSLVEKFPLHLTEVRGLGLMLGLVMATGAKALEEKLLDIGLITLATGEHVLRLLPPLNIKPSEVEEALDILADTCAELFAQAAPEKVTPE
ncbi:MAG: aspartate aminotransferase family protein [Lentisphaerae bacterium]|nr:aspartate aminotransferase family protein [Lentisphaerota bacterium]